MYLSAKNAFGTMQREQLHEWPPKTRYSLFIEIYREHTSGKCHLSLNDATTISSKWFFEMPTDTHPTTRTAFGIPREIGHYQVPANSALKVHFIDAFYGTMVHVSCMDTFRRGSEDKTGIFHRSNCTLRFRVPR